MINPIEYEIMATMTPEHRPPMKWGKLGVFAKRALPFGSCLLALALRWSYPMSLGSLLVGQYSTDF